MRAARHLVWPAGLGLLAVTVPVVGGLPATTYGGSRAWLLWLETCAALALLAAGTLEATTVRRAALQLTGALWLAPELAGWVSAPAELRMIADATGRLLPALAVVAVLALVPGRSSWARPVAIAALAGGVVAAGSRLLLVDPFTDPWCWRFCDHNPLLLADGGRLEALGLGVVALAAVAAGVGRTVPAAGFLAGLAAPGVLRWTVPESAESPWYLAAFGLAQVGAAGLAATLLTGRYRQWRLGARLTRLAGGLRAAPAPGALAVVLGRAVGDESLRILYWAANRGYVDADGRTVEEPAPAAGRRVTLVARHGHRMAALVHAARVDGDRLDRALRPALRLALENERLRAAVLAELHEVESSRARIVERAADERRRLERNLHDGAQQSVVSLSLLLNLLHGRAPRGAALDLARRAEVLTRSTLEELRRVARGIYPAILSDAGLAGAVQELADSSTDVAIAVRQVPAGRYKGTVETTAYLVVAAAVADARARSATTVSVCGTDRDGVLMIDMDDDAPPGPGDLTAGLSDQVGAVGGRVCTRPLPTGCGAAGGDKSGGTGTPKVLVLASNDGVDLAGAPAVQHFVDSVAKLSGGRLTVQVKPEWRGGGDEARVIKDVAAGQADLGWAGTRAFDLVGVDAFRPLHAPFLVSSYAAEAAVVRDPLAGRMLAGTAPLGLTGLALAADQLRFPAGTTKPLLSPADFAGRQFFTVASKVQSDGLRALGAEPTSEPVDDLLTGGRLAGLETMWWTYQARGYHEVTPFVTANAALWPRTLVVFANSRALAKLDKTAQGWVTKAASDASAWSAAHAGDAEPEHIDRACRFGARIALATPEQLAGLRKAAEPVYAAMRADPALRRVEELVAGAGKPAPVTVPAGCAYRPGEEKPAQPVALTGPGRPGALPAGVYRFSMSRAELLGLGLTDHDATINAGVVTWTLRGGNWTFRLDPVAAGESAGTCQGWYDVQGDAATFVTNTKVDGGTCAPPVWTARWSGAVTWSAVSVADYGPVFAGKPWQKIG